MKLTLVSVVAVVLPVSTVWAGVICVNPAAPTCKPTIQAAVAAASPGDVVRIGAGVFYEGVEVPAGKDGLRIVGAGPLATVIDAGPFADRGIAGAQTAMVVRSPRVLVQGLSVRNALTGIDVEASGVTVQSVRVTGVVVLGIDVAGGSDDVRLVGNEIRSGTFHEDGIQTNGVATVISNNVIHVPRDGLRLQGSAARATANRIENGFGIVATGDAGTIIGNDLEHNQFGISAYGVSPIVERNRVTGGAWGVLVSCPTCDAASISSNTIADTQEFGIVVVAGGAGLRVDRNTVARTRGVGIELTGDRITASLNQVVDVGVRGNDACFAVFGSGSALRRNTATHCSGAGFYVNGNDNDVERNTALRVYENGFTVDGRNPEGGAFAGARLRLNHASYATGQGFAVIGGAVQTQLVSNTGHGSRRDFCDDGVDTTASGNVFGAAAVTPNLDCVISHGTPD